MRTLLIAVEMLAASIWVGSLVCLALVSSIAQRTLDPVARVSLFRGIGRLYGVVGSGSLLVGIGTALALAWPPADWSESTTVMALLLGLLVLVAGIGMAQARRMTVWRRRALDTLDDRHAADQVRRGAVAARVLRGAIGLLTLVLLVLGAGMLNH